MDLIGDLLRAGLLEKLGDDQERAAHLREASKDLSQEFLAERRKQIPEAVVAGLAGDGVAPMLEVAAVRLTERWELFPNAFPKPPVVIFQAIVLAGLAEAARRDQSVLQAAWYTLRTAREVLPAERWDPVIDELGQAWDDSVEATVAEEWSPQGASSRLRMPTIRVQGTPAAPTNAPAQAQALWDSNPDYQAYPPALGPALPGYLSSVVNAGERALAESQLLSAEQLREAFKSLGLNLREVLSAHEQIVTANKRRTDLLWWRQSAYSPRLRQRYGEMSPSAEIAVEAAIDLHLQVAGLAPVAAEHLLADVVGEAAGDDEISIGELADSPQAAALREVIGERASGPLASALGSQPDASPLADSKVAPGRLAVLAFRDLQVGRILGSV